MNTSDKLWEHIWTECKCLKDLASIWYTNKTQDNEVSLKNLWHSFIKKVCNILYVDKSLDGWNKLKILARDWLGVKRTQINKISLENLWRNPISKKVSSNNDIDNIIQNQKNQN